MYPYDFIFSLFLIFAGASVFSTAALFTRQSLLVGYIVLGIVVGPWGAAMITDLRIVHVIGETGILFLLFLLGLHLHPQNLLQMFRRTSLVTVISAIVFFAVGVIISRLFGYSWEAACVVGAAMIFSSTIIGLKLLPTTVLHHQHTGEVMISVLLMQDLIAIATLLALNAAGTDTFVWIDIAWLLGALPGLLLFAFVVERYVLRPLLARFDRIREYTFLVAVGWCLTLSVLGHKSGLSYEIGAFLGGVSLAANPLSFYIAESLRPLRDFFLVMFFFSIGAGLNLNVLPEVIIPSLVLAAVILLVKPAVFSFLLRNVQETKHVANEVGVRLGQVSEFSLLVTSVALMSGLIDSTASYMLQTTTIITFVISSYIVVMLYPTPLATKERLRRD